MEKKIKQAKKPKTNYQPTEILTRSDVASLFKISLVTVHHWTQSGILTAYRLGSRVYFKRSDIDNAMTLITPKHNKGVSNG